MSWWHQLPVEYEPLVQTTSSRARALSLSLFLPSLLLVPVLVCLPCTGHQRPAAQPQHGAVAVLPQLRRRRSLRRGVPGRDPPGEQASSSTARGRRLRRPFASVDELLEPGAPVVAAGVQSHGRRRARRRAGVGLADLRPQHHAVLHRVRALVLYLE